MSNYLQYKFVGKYRVLAEYDQSTNDFIRDDNGTLSPEFDDFYIPCLSGGKIIHLDQDILQYYVQGVRKGRSILNNIKHDNTKVISLLFNIIETDNELTFCFKSSSLDSLEKYLKPKINGSSISPFSRKNLPKSLYKIPDNDIEKYRNVIEDKYTKGDTILGYLLSKHTKEFLSKIKKINGKKIDVTKMKKKECLKSKEFIHKIGLWDKYISFLKERGGN